MKSHKWTEVNINIASIKVRVILDRSNAGISGSGGEEKNFQPLPGLESQIIQPVAQRYTAELSCIAFFCIAYIDPGFVYRTVHPHPLWKNKNVTRN
jgi:hypothetical protein